MDLRVLLVALAVSSVLVRAEFELTVNFTNYTNPTGLCAECMSGLEAFDNADQLIPVCCDESPFRSDNCNNTGEARCDTRFRWTIRPFNASLETRPGIKYYFTDCSLPEATCPFSEMSTTFSQGPTGFLGVAANPLPVFSPPTLTSWTGKVQFFIEAVDSGLLNIIDSLLINLDNLQLGADFTKEMTFTGYHNISQVTMSFRVACGYDSCGSDCTALSKNNPRIQSCFNNGDIVCTNSRYDPSANCDGCLHNLNISTDCSTCLEPNFDPDTNCTQCLPNRDPSTNCSTCLFGWNINRDCSVCLPGRDISSNCTSCLTGYVGENCVLDRDVGAGAIAGGVVAVMAIAILVLTVVVIMLALRLRKRSNKNAENELMEALQRNDMTTAAPLQSSAAGMNAITPNVLHGVNTEPDRGDQTIYYVRTGIQMEHNPVYSIATADTDTDAIQLQPNVLYAVSTEPDRGDQTTYYENEGLGTQTIKQHEYDYIQ